VTFCVAAGAFNAPADVMYHDELGQLFITFDISDISSASYFFKTWRLTFSIRTDKH